MKNLIYSRWWFCFCFQLPTWGNSEIWEHLVLVLFHQQVDLLPYWYVIHVNCDHAASLGKREFPTPNKSLGCWRGVWCLFCGSKWSTAIQNRWHSPYILVYKGPLLTYWYLLVFVPSILTFRYVFLRAFLLDTFFFAFHLVAAIGDGNCFWNWLGYWFLYPPLKSLLPLRILIKLHPWELLVERYSTFMHPLPPFPLLPKSFNILVFNSMGCPLSTIKHRLQP